MIDFKIFLTQYSDDCVFNSLGIENLNPNGPSRLKHWLSHARDNHTQLDGDIFEIGVYEGGGTIAMALQSKMLNSNKKVYAFDSFSGFPAYHQNDDFRTFAERPDLFDAELQGQARLCKGIAEWRLGVTATAANISTSGDFSDGSRELFESRLNAFGLDNVEIIEGNLKETTPEFMNTFTGSVFSENIDCDFYDGYRIPLGAIYLMAIKDAMIYLDEYYSLKFPGPRIAVSEFREMMKESVTLLSDRENDFQRWAILKQDQDD